MPGLPINESEANDLLADVAAQSHVIGQASVQVESTNSALADVQEANATIRNEALPALRALSSKRQAVERMRRDLAALQGK